MSQNTLPKHDSKDRAVAAAAQDPSIRTGYFSEVTQADEAIKRLFAAGISKEEIAVICPEQLRAQFTHDVAQSSKPGANAPEGVVLGGAIGATLGGLALTTAAIATGGAALIPALPVLVGGGALAGGISGLILADGYGKEIGEQYEEAIRLGKIVVAVKIKGQSAASKLEKADGILKTVANNAG